MNGSILIPENFRLNRKKIRVVINDTYCNENKYLGEAHFDNKVITLASKNKGRKLTKKVKEQTFFHELVHMVFDACEKEEMKYDEELVDNIAMKLYEYEKSKQ